MVKRLAITQMANPGDLEQDFLLTGAAWPIPILVLVLALVLRLVHLSSKQAVCCFIQTAAC